MKMNEENLSIVFYFVFLLMGIFCFVIGEITQDFLTSLRLTILGSMMVITGYMYLLTRKIQV